MWPVAMTEAFAMVKVGNSAWLLRRLTPSRASAAMVGAVTSSTERKRKPSATNSTTLCGRAGGACPNAAVAVLARTALRINCRRIQMLQVHLHATYDYEATGWKA